MTKTNNDKFSVAIILIGIIISLLIGMNILSNAYAYFNTGASKKNILNEAEMGIANHTPLMTYIDNGNYGREVSPYNLERIYEDYANAWYYRNIAHNKSYSENTEMYWTEKRSLDIKNWNTINYNENNKGKHIERTDIEHALDVHVFSLDGQIITFTDSAALVHEQIYDNEQFISHRQYEEVNDVVMILQDETWHIKHIVPRSKKWNPKQKKQEKIKNSFYHTRKKEIYIKDEIFYSKGINYYPQYQAWDMWDDFEIETISKDLEMIKSLGLNTVRIFIPYGNFGKGHVDYKKLNHLQAFLDQAENKEIAVIVTLFDFVNDYQIANWSGTDRQLEAILSRFKNHKAILAWDLKNEADLDFEYHGRDEVLDWLQFIIDRTYKYDPNHLITIGWSNIKDAQLLSDELDLISYHFYHDMDKFDSQLKELNEKINNKPILLGEFGMTTFNSYLFPFGRSEKEQAHHVYNIKKTLYDNDNHHFLAWTLYDFDDIPHSIFGFLPWKKRPQKNYGIIKLNGEKKMASYFLSNNINKTKPIEISFWDKILKPFHFTVLVLLIFFFLIAIFIRKKKKHKNNSHIN